MLKQTFIMKAAYWTVRRQTNSRSSHLVDHWSTCKIWSK